MKIIKLKGEKHVEDIFSRFFITNWLISSLMKENDENV